MRAIKKFLSISVVLTLLFSPVTAMAAVCGGLNPILVLVTPVAFGNYDALINLQTTINGTITVTCTVVLGATLPSFTVALSTGGANSYNSRKMFFFSNTLNYNIYTTSGYDTVWGDGTGGTAIQSYSSGDGLALKNFTAYGALAPHQYVPTGIYLDSITVTITY